VLLVSQSANGGYNEANKYYNTNTNKDEGHHAKTEYSRLSLLCANFGEISGLFWDNYWFWLSLYWFCWLCRFYWLYWLFRFNYFVGCELAGSVKGNKAELSDASIGLPSIEADDRVCVIKLPRN